MIKLKLAMLLTVMLSSTLAIADQQDPKVLAEALFQDGRTLLEQGKSREACEKFTMSQRIEPKLGTLLNLASCHEQTGRTASAWAEFTEATTAAARVGQNDREAFAREGAARLAPLLSRVALVNQSDNSPLPTHLTVLIDGVVLDQAALGTAFPVDPGDHTLVVRAPGRKAWTHIVNAPAGPSLTSIAVPPLPLEDDSPPVSDERSTTTPPAAIHPGAWISIGVAVAGAAVGGYAGLTALSLDDRARSECNAAACSQRGLDLHSEASTLAHVSTGAFATMIVAVAVGVYFLVSSSGSSPSTKPSSLRTGLTRW
jgi:hypothetical protein